MRIVEIVLLICTAGALAVPAARVRLDWLLLLCAVLSLVGQLCLEGYRWQLAPADLAVAMLVAAGAWSWLTSDPEPQVVTWIGWGLIAATLSAATLFPVAEIPSPTGPFAVGTVVRHLVDAGRAETLATNYHGPRELMIQIWYPAELPGYRAAPREGSFMDQIRRMLFGRPRRRALPQAPLSPAQPSYPVVIFSPSWRGQRGQNLFQVEELASRGYLVVGIDHPYMSAATAFPDGRVVRPESSDFWDLSSDDNLRRSLAKIEREFAVRVRDIQFVASELGRINRRGSGDRFSGRLDLERIGVLGYSFGGAAGAQVCREDRRFKAGIDMGGSLFGEVAEAGAPWPFLFMDDETRRPPAYELTQSNPSKRRYAQWVERDFRLEAHSLEKYGGYRVAIAGTEHGNFTDPPAAPSLRYYLSDLGRINPARAFQIINAFTVAFFDQYLRDIPQPLMARPSAAFPEVRFTYQPPLRNPATPQ